MADSDAALFDVLMVGSGRHALHPPILRHPMRMWQGTGVLFAAVPLPLTLSPRHAAYGLCCGAIVVIVMIVLMAENVDGNLPEPSFVISLLILVPLIAFCILGIWLIRKFTLDSFDKFNKNGGNHAASASSEQLEDIVRS